MSLDIFNNLWEYLATNLGFKILKIILILILFFIFKGIGKKAINQAFKVYQEKQQATKARVYTMEKLVNNILSYVLIFIMIVMIFNTLGIHTASLIAGAGVVGLAIGFGAQGLVSDVVTGFFILLEKQMDVGEVVTIGSYNGIVEEVGLRTTQVRGFDGILHFIPNRNISSLSNHSRGNMRALVDIGISYDEDIDEALKVIQEVCEQVAQQEENIVEGPDVIGVQALNSSDVVLRVIAQTKNGEQFGVERTLKKAIKEALDAHNIEIPFPHQVMVHKQERSQG
ncbi:small conductance mechanosensitive channel [Pullulanibacillus pueri]|uniref:Putative MscS family protein YkuT n=2 Tax=Pullulanibacillus pueri TaxID=1437324 RepID=A0A8J2ZSN5_9BACL|nr:mechanosensitive ion channel family protein [Pullulanibacillus pueri]MBM7680056.1 small conductance mechanosensitive channel [Pullulanibacillus pueri]GGH74142.1 putative MscS family protein YkuT [Pullulanibacillus pueri]